MGSDYIVRDVLLIVLGLALIYMAVRAASHAWYAGKLKHHHRVLKSINEPEEK